MTAGELARSARGLVATSSGLSGIWPRAAALLGRQALEQAMDDLWRAVSPRVREVSRHAQLLCLKEFVGNEELVTGIRHAWHGLSRACHHQVYELSPTAEELGRWLEAVEWLVEYDPVRRVN